MNNYKSYKKTNMLNNNNFIPFKELYTFEERKRKAEELLSAYPERILTII